MEPIAKAAGRSRQRAGGVAEAALSAESLPQVVPDGALTTSLGVEPELLRGVLSEQIKDVLLRWIMEGRLPLGARIVETRIARTLGTSQAPVREALRDLETLGVVEIEAFRGARVRKPTNNELLEAFSVRAALEALASFEATPRITPSQLEELEHHLELMRDAAARGDVHAHAISNANFHATIVKAAGNRTLTRVWSVLEPFARTYITATMAATNLDQLAERHARIIGAIRSGNAELASEVTREHLLEAREILRTGLETANDRGTAGDGR